MQGEGNALVKFEDLLERLERVEDELLQSIESEPALFRVPGVLELTGQLKAGLRSLRTARDATRAQAARRTSRSDHSCGR